MISPSPIPSTADQANFESVIRDWDEVPRHAFSVQLAEHPKLYGVWEPVWAPNENDFNVKVTGFGWASKYGVGNPSPMTRKTLSSDEANTVRELVTALFNDESIRKNTTPFSSKKAKFLGRIEFQKNWIVAE